MRNAILVSFLLCGTAWAGRGASDASLASAIASGSPDAIVSEVERAEKLACQACIPRVMALVDHPEARVRDVAAWWLAKRAVRGEVRDAATARLKGRDATLARYGAEALGTMRHPEAVPALAAYLAQPLDGASAAAAATALGVIGHPSAKRALESGLTSTHAEARAASARSLRELRGGADAKALLPLLGDPDEEVRTQAIYTLGALGDRAAVAPLMTVVGKDASAAVRKHAVWALGQLGDASAMPALDAAREDPDPLVRSVARAAISRLR